MVQTKVSAKTGGFFVYTQMKHLLESAIIKYYKECKAAVGLMNCFDAVDYVV